MRIDQTRQEAVAYWFALVVGAQEQARIGNGTDTVQVKSSFDVMRALSKTEFPNNEAQGLVRSDNPVRYNKSPM